MLDYSSPDRGRDMVWYILRNQEVSYCLIFTYFLYIAIVVGAVVSTRDPVLYWPVHCRLFSVHTVATVFHAAIVCRRPSRRRAPSSPERGRYIGGVCKMYRYLHYIHPFMTCKPAMLVSNCQNQKCMFSNICYRTYITGKVRTGHKLCNNTNGFLLFHIEMWG